MMKWKHILLMPLLTVACQQANIDTSDLKVTSVDHTSVKQQSIGNCWLYAHATWLESKLKTTTGENVDVSETYWTYWDFYEKLVELRGPGEKIATGGWWHASRDIIKKYGWVEEKDFISEEQGLRMSQAQSCAESHINKALQEDGDLHLESQRSEENILRVLNKGFSCDGRFQVNMETAQANSRLAKETMLLDVKSNELKTLEFWLNQWKEVQNYAYPYPSAYEQGKKLPSASTMNQFRSFEQRIKRALNDRQPVVLAFYVSFNAPNNRGLFNLETLAKSGDLGDGGGHMVVLHDYTVHINGHDEIDYLGEGEMDDDMKALALQGELDYLVAKNSWGADRANRPWLGDGYSRLSWDYLTSRYYDEERKIFIPMLSSIVFPPGY